MASRRPQTRFQPAGAVPTWVWLLAAMRSLELPRVGSIVVVSTARAATFSAAAPPAHNSAEVMREALRLSSQASSVRIDHVRDVLDDLADELLVECERVNDEVRWRLLDLGRERLRKCAGAFAELAQLAAANDDQER
jgi:hypothetical protein